MATSIDIPLIISELFLLADRKPEYGWLGDRSGGGESDYGNLDWRDKVIPKPTLQTITDAWPAVEQKYFTDANQAKTDRSALIAALRAGAVSAEVLQNTVADILEGK